MSGKRHHTVPQFLLNGFSSSIRGKEVYTWFYRKGQTGIEVNIKNVGVEGNVYGEKLDDQITNLEDQHAALVQDLRSLPEVGPVVDRRIAALIAHLSLRTRSLRQSIIDAMDTMMDGLRVILTDKKVLAEGLRREFGTPDFRKLLQANLDKEGENQEQGEALVALLQANAAVVLERLSPNLNESLAEHFAFLRANTPTVLRDAHIKSLTKDPNAEQRAATYAPFRWFIIRPTAPIYLGDTVCIFETIGARRFKPLDGETTTYCASS